MKYICKQCGGKMSLSADNLVVICDKCGDWVEIEDYDTIYVDYAEMSFSSEEPLNIPEGCRACGGAYPSCKSSCSLFDE